MFIIVRLNVVSLSSLSTRQYACGRLGGEAYPGMPFCIAARGRRKAQAKLASEERKRQNATDEPILRSYGSLLSDGEHSVTLGPTHNPRDLI